MTDRIWILGASDPEMEAIERMLREYGETVVYATDGGKRVHSSNAYRADGVHVPDNATVYLVECACPLLDAQHDDYSQSATRIVIDHHRPGDPGFGRPPAEFLVASSLGQVIGALVCLGRALPREWEESLETWDGCSVGIGTVSYHAPHWIVTRGCRGSDAQWYGQRIPSHLVLTAAADHCLGAAYRGECPGVDPDELMRWRAESRAEFQARTEPSVTADVILARIAETQAALELADRERLGDIDERGWCNGCGRKVQPTEDNLEWDYCECPDVRDMRRDTPWPELSEAATRLGVGYVSGPLATPDGRRKFTCSGTFDQVRAFLDTWAPSNGLIDLYGDPERGFAGGYEVVS